MDRAEELVTNLLKEHGAQLVRERKHKVWRLPDGRTWVHPSTASDAYAWKNNLSDLRNYLGVNGVRGLPGDRREKRIRAKSSPRKSFVGTGVLGTRVIHDALVSVKIAYKPRYRECSLFDKRVVMKTFVTVLMERIFGRQ